MTLFEFDIEWDQAINTSFDQDDVKTTGKVRVQTDGVTVLAPDIETARRALTERLRYYNMQIRAERTRRLHLIADYSTKSVTSIAATRRVGPEELNAIGRAAQKRGIL